MIQRKVARLVPPVVGRAKAEPACLGADHRNFWEDIRSVLLDSDPDPWKLEVVRRWLRDDVESEILKRLRGDFAASHVRHACRVSPRLLWKLPYSRGNPPERYHRRIAAILLPIKLRLLETQLAMHAFHEGLAGDNA